MAIRDASAAAHLSLVEGSDGPWSFPPDNPSSEEPDWRSLSERAHARAESEGARADAAEARIQELLGDIRRLRASLRKTGAAGSTGEPLPRGARGAHKAPRRLRRNDTIGSLHVENAELREEATTLRKAAGAAQTSLSRKDARLLKARERSQAQRSTIEELRRQVRSLERQVARQSRDLEEAESRRQTIRDLSRENAELRGALRDWRDQVLFSGLAG